LIHRLSQLLATKQDEAQAQADLMTWLEQQGRQYTSSTDLELKTWMAHFTKITHAFAPKLFTYRRQHLLPRTNNDLEVFIGQLKKTRRQVTGRKNIHAFILREGAGAALYFSLSRPMNWAGSFAQVNYLAFRHNLNQLRCREQRSKVWQIQHHFHTYLMRLEQQWQEVE
jgi:hypothetical protein